MVRLVRESSDTPNITNKDDARMIRYAYGGIDGVIKSFGKEFDYTIDTTNHILKIGSGRFVLQGWEVDLDEAGWTLDFGSAAEVRYYTAYLEVNLTLETAEVKATYGLSTYPTIDEGDDLTSVPSGIARRVLYNFTVTRSGTAIGIISKEFSIIEYPLKEAQKIQSDLTAFKSSVSSAFSGLRTEIDNKLKYYFKPAVPKRTISTTEGTPSTLDYPLGSTLVMYTSGHDRVTIEDGSSVAYPAGTVLEFPITTTYSGKTSTAYLMFDRDPESFESDIVLHSDLSKTWGAAPSMFLIPGVWVTCGKFWISGSSFMVLIQRVE